MVRKRTTTESSKNTMMEAINGDDFQELNVPDTSQLPSVEEYKAGARYRKKGSFQTSIASNYLHQEGHSDPEARPDPEGFVASSEDDLILKRSTSTGNSTDDEEYETHDWGYSETLAANQTWLPSNRTFCIVLTLIVFLTIIAEPIFNSTKGEDDSSVRNWVMHSERYLSIENFLTVNGISNPDDFSQDSPQVLAAEWMAYEDEMQLPIPSVMDEDAYTFIERYVMVVFYYATGGPNWIHHLNFLSPGHITTWKWNKAYDPSERLSLFDLVQDFDGNSTILGVHACRQGDGGYSHPCGLSIPNNKLSGTIPNEIGFLSHLKTLLLPYNLELTGSLPNGLGRMENLSQLCLHWSGLSGTIPNWISNLENLRVLGLGNNHFTGTAPNEIGLMSNLEVLGLDNNMLKGDINVFGSLFNLKSLFLENNHITGEISNNLVSRWTNLQVLDLGDNEVRGTLPLNFFQNNEALKVLDLHGNKLFGSIPNQSFSSGMARLEVLAIHDNKFTGTVPESIANLRWLKHLDLSLNSFSGAIPNRLEELTTLEYLFLGDNELDSSSMPECLKHLTNLRDLSIRSSLVTGSIPTFLAQLSKLEYLDLNNNKIEGTIPSLFGSLTELQVLLLKKNLLTGSLPLEIQNLSKLAILLLEQNNMDDNSDMICKTPSINLSYFVTDCNYDASFKCTCCDLCCGQDPDCNSWNWDGNLDPAWEHGFQRNRYSYDMGPHMWMSP